MKLRKYHFFLLFILIIESCIDEIQLKTETTFESAFVVEATITDELKHQEIKLSKAYELGAEIPLFESNANVIIVDENNVEYVFAETEP